MSEPNLDILSQQLDLLNTDSNGSIFDTVQSTGSLGSEFIILSNEPIPEEIVDQIGIPEPTNEQKAIKIKFLQELFDIQNKNNKEAGIPVRNNENENESEAKKAQAIRLYTPEKIAEIINLIKNPDPINKNGYHYRKNFAINPLNPNQLLKKEKIASDKPPQVVVSTDDLFDVCMEVHKKVGCQGTSVMEPEAKKLYYNISRSIITIFLKYSAEYQIKRKKTKTAGQVIKPIISDMYNSRAQIDLVDMSSLQDSSVDPPYRYIFNCQDHLTKFCHLRGLKDCL